MNRFDRITAILIHLQSRKIVSANELAKRFGVSLRTIYRDIRSLEQAGVPISGEAGVGYSIMEGYRLPPVMFTSEEASSFVTAEKLMEKFTEHQLNQHFQSAMYKIKAVLKGGEKDLVDQLESYIEINPTHPAVNEDIPNALSILIKAIADRKIVTLNYKPTYADDAGERSIEPVGVFHENQYWYVMAFCHLRNDYRQFRADRMKKIKVTTIPFTRKHGPLQQYRKKEAPPHELTAVVIQVEKSVARHLCAQKNYMGFVSEYPVDDTYLEMTFKLHHVNDGFARWFMMFADSATIIKPHSLRERVNEMLEMALSKNRQNVDS